MAQIIFAVLLLGTGILFAIGVRRIASNIKLGLPWKAEGSKKERLKQMVLVAFGQKKMFKRPIPALLHLFVYVGFLIVNIEMLEIVLDGILGTHRLFLSSLGNIYPYLIGVFEFFAVTVLLACTVFLVRRNILRLPRFHKKEMGKWPKMDGNLILVFEIVLMFALLSMNATEQLLQATGNEHYAPTGNLFFSALLKPLYASLSASTLVIVERTFWWVHIIGVFIFANYVLFSKHLHIFLAFPNTYFSNLNPKGKMKNMDMVTNEVKLMLGLPGADATPSDTVPRFGVKDVNDLPWKSILEAYTCTECGRCTSNCPANLTGKELSPRKIMMDVRDRAEELGALKRKNGAEAMDEKALVGNYVSEEELLACTSCNACTEACPVNIDPLSIILEMRRYQVMELSKAPQSWTMMFSNLETSFAPWKFPPTDRFKWKEGLKK